MKNPASLRRKWQKVLVIIVCWTLFELYSYVNNYFFVTDLIQLGKLEGHYAFWPDFLAHLILGIIGGLLGGYLLIFKMDRRYKQKSFAFGVLNSGALFIFFYLLFAVVGVFGIAWIYFSFQMDVLAAAQRSWVNVVANLYTPSFFTSMILIAALVSATQFMLQVDDKFGSGVLWKFITGKYYLPRQEERIFMFMDLKSSTTIAEKIGNRQFFELLKDLYRDVTEPIIESLGEIYQYVGDEVIVSWTIHNGIKDNNCLTCFFEIEKLLKDKSAQYLQKYGAIPIFKAGLHLGEATVGEIGVIKKDIVFSGDVLNTTSRIQGECNHYKVNVLVSSDLLQMLHMDGYYRAEPVGDIKLRGKEQTVALSAVKLKDTAA